MASDPTPAQRRVLEAVRDGKVRALEMSPGRRHSWRLPPGLRSDVAERCVARGWITLGREEVRRFYRDVALTDAGAGQVARSHYHDTGQPTEVVQLAVPLSTSVEGVEPS
jgi:hypothetical protein